MKKGEGDSSLTEVRRCITLLRPLYQNTLSVQFSLVTQWYLTLCDPMNRSMPGLPVHHQLLEFTQTHVLKAQHSENEDHGIWSHHFMGNRWGNGGNSVRLYFGGAPKSLQMVTAAMKLKDAYSLEEKLRPT